MRSTVAQISPQMPKGKLSDVFGIWSYFKPYKLLIFIMMLGLVISAFTMLFIVKGVGIWIDNGITSSSRESLSQIFYISIAVVMILGISTFARYISVAWLGEKVMADIRADIYKHALLLHRSFYERTQSGEVTSLISGDTTFLLGIITSSMSSSIRNLIMLFGGTIMLFLIDWRLTLLLFTIIPVVLVPVIILGRKVKSISRDVQDSIAVLNGRFQQSILLIDLIQSYCAEKTEVHEFKENIENYLGKSWKRIIYRGFLVSMVIVIVLVSINIALYVGAEMVISNEITSGDLASFIFLSLLCSTSLNSLIEFTTNLQKAGGAISRIKDFLTTRSDIIAGDQKVTSFESLEFRDVRFSYPMRPDDYVLSGLSFKVTKGQKIAIVGASGMGKTTIFHLISRLYNVSSGSILINGIDVDTITLASLRSLFATVHQDVPIINTTIENNIKYGCAKKVGEQEVVGAAKQANILRFIELLPEKLKTVVGENGIRLSRGQKQRIAIARALLANREVILLDEATSSLDTDNETHILQTLDKVKKTMVIIAHRVSTIQQADTILFLKDGKVIKSGKHNELLKFPEYKELVKSQIQKS